VSFTVSPTLQASPRSLLLVLEAAKFDDRVRVLLWTGHGRAFSSGADLAGKGPQEPVLPADALKWYKMQGFNPGFPTNDGALKCLTIR